MCSVRNSFGQRGDHFGTGGTHIRLLTKVICCVGKDSNERRTALMGRCGRARISGLGADMGELHSRLLSDQGRARRTVNHTNVLRGRLTRYRDGGPIVRAIVRGTGALRSVMAFHRNDSGISISRLPGIRQVTSCVGERPRSGIIVGKCSSPRKDVRIGREVTYTHTRSIGSVLVGGCQVTTSHVATRKRNVKSVFSRPS